MRPKKRFEQSCGKRSRSARILHTIDDVVQDYIAQHRRGASVEMRWFASRPNLREAVRLASLCRTPDGKRHPHQRRIPEAALQAAHERLERSDLKSCTTFDELYQHVSDVVGEIGKIGELTIYDIACRIGAFLKLEPDRVYLHRGTRVGARYLGLARGRTTIEVDELPNAFAQLKAGEIEDCLCLYKDQLRNIRIRPGRNG